MFRLRVSTAVRLTEEAGARSGQGEGETLNSSIIFQMKITTFLCIMKIDKIFLTEVLRLHLFLYKHKGFKHIEAQNVPKKQAYSICFCVLKFALLPANSQFSGMPHVPMNLTFLYPSQNQGVGFRHRVCEAAG